MKENKSNTDQIQITYYDYLGFQIIKGWTEVNKPLKHIHLQNIKFEFVKKKMYSHVNIFYWTN